MSATAQRNENVAVYLIDNNAIKEANIRIGTTATATFEPAGDVTHFSTEHGRPAGEALVLRRQRVVSGWHGELFGMHQNSVFNSRTFFQVGGVKPSRRNYWGGRVGGTLPKLGFFSFNGAQRDVRGMVNGNVLVPLAGERTPLATDPARRAFVQRILDAYPNELPNRPDFDIRALNTNAPQRIDEINGAARLDTDIGPKNKLLLLHSIERQRIDAFQLIGGQNPDTSLHTQRSRLTWRRELSASTELNLSAGFQRTRSVLLPDETSVGPRIRMGFQIEELGPDSQFPINRAATTFRYGGSLAHATADGKHSFSLGGTWFRFQLNGVESANLRGYYQFTNNFGRQAIENVRLGTPSTYEVTIGELARGYRNWSGEGWVTDRWRLHPRLQLFYGLRWSGESQPYEIRGREAMPYDGDFNNFAPRFALAWRIGAGWTGRAVYTTAFSQILPVTYQQIRNNPPGVRYIQVQEPDLVNPLRGINLNDPNARYSPTWIAPELTSPYSHLYSAQLERSFLGTGSLRLTYVGSRTIKLLNSFILNRAEPVADVSKITPATVDARRPDPRYYEIRQVVNGGVAWYDAGQMTLTMPVKRGFTGMFQYTFSKGLDQGVDFSSTAANRDILSQRSQYQFDSYQDRKGLSNFDSTHSYLWSYSYDVPVFQGTNRLLKAITRDWQLSGVCMWKTGTPLTLYIGSDAPGFGNVDGGPSDRPHIVDPSILGSTIGNPDTAPLILRRERFAFLRPGEKAGNLGRNNFRKAPIWNWNAGVTRVWRLGATERSVQIRAEAYNLTNTPQFDEPQRNLSAPPFGKIKNTLNDGRVFQFVLRLFL